MQKTKTAIALGERLIFWAYTDETVPASEHIFTPGQFLVVAAINDDGGLQCFPTDEDGKIVSHEGDTVFDEEVLRLFYAPRMSVRVLG